MGSRHQEVYLPRCQYFCYPSNFVNFIPNACFFVWHGPIYGQGAGYLLNSYRDYFLQPPFAAVPHSSWPFIPDQFWVCLIYESSNKCSRENDHRHSCRPAKYLSFIFIAAVTARAAYEANDQYNKINALWQCISQNAIVSGAKGKRHLHYCACKNAFNLEDTDDWPSNLAATHCLQITDMLMYFMMQNKW